jgi:hypothetical protein
MQARTTVNELVVGHQHNYRGLFHLFKICCSDSFLCHFFDKLFCYFVNEGIFSALVTIIRQEGFSALYKGSMMSVLRSTLGITPSLFLSFSLSLSLSLSTSHLDLVLYFIFLISRKWCKFINIFCFTRMDLTQTLCSR